MIVENLSQKLRKYILHIFFPTVCPYCERVIYPDEYACEQCRKKLPDKSLTKYARGGYLCSAPLPYDEPYSTAVKTFKFRNMGSYAPQLSFLVVQSILEIHRQIDFDLITCVPMHVKDKKKRGYNQAELLAKECAKIMNIPYADLLEKHKQNKAQHTLKSSEREKNVRGVFRAASKNEIEGKSILIIDDIITTGNTLGECCRILIKARAKRVCCAALCSA